MSQPCESQCLLIFEDTSDLQIHSEMNKSLRRSVCYNVSCYRFLAGFGNWKLTAKLRQISNLLSGWASCPDTCSLVKHHWINPGSTISISRCFKARTVFVSKVRNNKTFLKAWLKHIFIGGKKTHGKHLQLFLLSQTWWWYDKLIHHRQHRCQKCSHGPTLWKFIW